MINLMILVGAFIWVFGSFRYAFWYVIAILAVLSLIDLRSAVEQIIANTTTIQSFEMALRIR